MLRQWAIKAFSLITTAVAFWSVQYPSFYPVMNIDKDYHIGVDYSSTSCAHHKKYCDSSEAVKAELMVRINLSTGYPQNSAWGCNGSLTISPLSDPVLIDAVSRAVNFSSLQSLSGRTHAVGHDF